MKEYDFYIRVFKNGNKAISSFFLNQKINLLALIIDQLGHSATELESYKSRLIEVIDKRERQLVSYNTLYIYVSGDKSEIGQNDFGKEAYQTVETSNNYQLHRRCNKLF